MFVVIHDNYWLRLLESHKVIVTVKYQHNSRLVGPKGTTLKALEKDVRDRLRENS